MDWSEEQINHIQGTIARLVFLIGQQSCVVGTAKCVLQWARHLWFSDADEMVFIDPS